MQLSIIAQKVNRSVVFRTWEDEIVHNSPVIVILSSLVGANAVRCQRSRRNARFWIGRFHDILANGSLVIEPKGSMFQHSNGKTDRVLAEGAIMMNYQVLIGEILLYEEYCQ